MRHNGRSYQSRAISLRNLGFSSYRSYLKSPLWAEVREKVFQKKGRFCQLCSKPATQVHHNRYLECDLTGRRIKYLAPMCDGCHFGIEFKNGEKSTVAQAKKRFKKKRKVIRAEIVALTELLLNFDADQEPPNERTDDEN